MERHLALVTVALVGLLALPASASSKAPGTYRGTIEIDQVPVRGTLPTGESSASYHFHALYSVSGRRVPAYRRPGVQYPLTGRGNQTFAYSANLKSTESSEWTHVSDWHGSGAWTRRSGNVAVLDVASRRFALAIALELRPGSIPLAVSSEGRSVSTDCITRWGQSGSTIWDTGDCGDSPRSLDVPVATAINPDVLLRADALPGGVCRGTRTVVRGDYGHCGPVERSGTIRRVYRTVVEFPLDYPFRPWKDEDAAFDAMEAANQFIGPLGLWGSLVIRTTFAVNLKPGK